MCINDEGMGCRVGVGVGSTRVCNGGEVLGGACIYVDDMIRTNAVHCQRAN